MLVRRMMRGLAETLRLFRTTRGRSRKLMANGSRRKSDPGLELGNVTSTLDVEGLMLEHVLDSFPHREHTR